MHDKTKPGGKKATIKGEIEEMKTEQTRGRGQVHGPERVLCLVCGDVTTDDVDILGTAKNKGGFRVKCTRVSQRMYNEFILENVREKCRKYMGNYNFFETCSTHMRAGGARILVCKQMKRKTSTKR